MINQMGINIILYFAMAVVGYVGAYMEIFLKKRYFLHVVLFLILFYFTAISRIGHSYEYSDFLHYIDYFMSDNDAYFEPGYVLITLFVKETFGYSPFHLVSTIIFLVLIAIFLTESVLAKGYCADCNITRFKRYIFTFLILYCINGGIAACSEGLRPGLSSAYMLICIALTLNRRWWLSVAVLILATMIHTQAFIFLPGIIILFFIDTLSRRFLFTWFTIIVVLGVLIAAFGIFNFSIFDLLLNYLDRRADVSHYEAYSLATDGSFLNTQWITRHFYGLLLLFGNLSNKKYNRAVILYFMGLSIGAIMQSSTIFIRFQGVYTASFLLAFYYFLRDDSFSKSRRLFFLTAYLPYQGIMLVRWLGWYI